MLQIFYHILSLLVGPYLTLQHLIVYTGEKTIFIWQLEDQFQGLRFFITSDHALSLVITHYHTLLSPRLERTIFIGKSKISFQGSVFLSHLVNHFHSFSHLIIPNFNAGKKIIIIWQLENQFPFGRIFITSYCALPLVATPYRLITGDTQVGKKIIFIWKLSSCAAFFYQILSSIVTPYQTSSHLISYTGNKTIFL